MPEVLLQVRLHDQKKIDETFEIAEKAGFDGIELECSSVYDIDRLYVRTVDYNLPVRSLLAPVLTFKKPVHYLLHGDIYTHTAYSTFKPSQIVFGIPNTPLLKDLSSYMFKDRLEYFKGLYGNQLITIENGAPQGSLKVPPIMNIKQIRDLAYDLDIFINFDVANCAASGYDILQTYDMIAPRIKSVHISDHGGESSRHHLVPGNGLLPLGMLLSKMKANKFNGFFTIELDPKELADKDACDLIVLYKELIGYVKSHFEKKVGPVQ